MTLNPVRRLRRVIAVGAVAAGSLALCAPAGAAMSSTYSTLFAGQTQLSECAPPPLVQAFLPFGDTRFYALAPNGNFLNAAGGGWQFSAGAGIVTATRPYAGTGTVLRLPPGATALSPLMCVDLDYPSARMWTAGASPVNVKVIYPDAAKAMEPKTVGDVKPAPGGAWKLSNDVDVQPQLSGKYLGWRRVAFLLTNTGKTATAQVDDLYVDPRMR